MLGGQRLRRRQDAARGVKQDGVGVGAAGIETEKKWQGCAGLIRKGATFSTPPRKWQGIGGRFRPARGRECDSRAATKFPNHSNGLTGSRSVAWCERKSHKG